MLLKGFVVDQLMDCVNLQLLSLQSFGWVFSYSSASSSGPLVERRGLAYDTFLLCLLTLPAGDLEVSIFESNWQG